MCVRKAGENHILQVWVAQISEAEELVALPLGATECIPEPGTAFSSPRGGGSLHSPSLECSSVRRVGKPSVLCGGTAGHGRVTVPGRGCSGGPCSPAAPRVL